MNSPSKTRVMPPPGETPAGPPAGPAFVEQPLLAEFERLTRRFEQLDELLMAVGRLMLEQDGCLGLWLLRRGTDQQWQTRPLANANLEETAALHAAIEGSMRELADYIAQTESVSGLTLNSSWPVCLAGAPVHDGNLGAPLQALLVGCFDQSSQSLVKCQWLLDRAAHAVQQWCLRQRLNQHQRGFQESRRAFAGLRDLATATSWNEASQRFVERVLQCSRAELVVLCLGAGRRLRLSTAAGVEYVDPGSDFARELVASCCPAAADRRSLNVAAADGPRQAAELPLARFAESQGFANAAVFPLEDTEGALLGTVLLAGNSSLTIDADPEAARPDWLQPLAEQLAVCRLAFQGRRRQWWHALQSRMRGRAGIGLAALSLGLLLLMALPLPYRIACDCELQPLTRRLVAAPFDGVLEASLVDNGQAVEAGQVVARLDGRQLRMELASAEAEFEAAAKRHSSALAQRQVAQSQIARSEMERYAADAELIRDKLERLEIRAPLGGIVISDDLRQAIGAPVEVGQTLLEVAPVDRMRVEVAVPESEVSHVEPGMPVSIKLHAFPFRTFNGTVETIHASSEVVDDEVVFVAQVTLENPQWQLKPGMHGSAKILSHRHALGWNLFHRPWEAVRHWAIW